MSAEYFKPGMPGYAGTVADYIPDKNWYRIRVTEDVYPLTTEDVEYYTSHLAAQPDPGGEAFTPDLVLARRLFRRQLWKSHHASHHFTTSRREWYLAFRLVKLRADAPTDRGWRLRWSLWQTPMNHRIHDVWVWGSVMFEICVMIVQKWWRRIRNDRCRRLI